MRRVRGVLFTAVLFLGGVSASAQSQCDAILQYGVFDLSNTASDDALFSSLFRYLEKQSARSHSDVTAAARNIGISIPGVGALDAGRADSSGSTDSASDFLKQIEAQDSASSRSFRQTFKTANPNIIAAWADCNKGGSRVWAERVDARTFYLKARWSQTEGESRPTIEAATLGNATCDRKAAAFNEFENQAPGNGPLSTLCTQTDPTIPAAINVVFSYSGGQRVARSFTLYPLPQPPAAPKVPAPIIIPVTKTTEMGYVGFDEADQMTTLGDPSQGPQNVSFTVSVPKSGEYLVWLQMASNEPHEMWVYLDIAPQPETGRVLKFEPAATGGYGPANLRWVPVTTLILSSNQQRKLTFTAPRKGYVSGMIPRIRGIKLQEVP